MTKNRVFPISIQPEFAEAIKRGTKRSTMRPKGKREYKVGDTLRLYEGLRNKEGRKAELLGKAVITRVDVVKFKYQSIPVPFYPSPSPECYDGRVFGEAEVKRDGFADIAAMSEWFCHKYGEFNLCRGKLFYLIQWEELQ